MKDLQTCFAIMVLQKAQIDDLCELVKQSTEQTRETLLMLKESQAMHRELIRATEKAHCRRS